MNYSREEWIQTNEKEELLRMADVAVDGSDDGGSLNKCIVRLTSNRQTVRPTQVRSAYELQISMFWSGTPLVNK